MSLGRVRYLSGGGQSGNGTHYLLLTTHILRAFRYPPRRIENSGVGVRNSSLDIGSNGMDIHDIVASGRGGWVRVCCKFPPELKVNTRLDSNGTTHVEDLENLVEVRLPSGGGTEKGVICT